MCTIVYICIYTFVHIYVCIYIYTICIIAIIMIYVHGHPSQNGQIVSIDLESVCKSLSDGITFVYSHFWRAACRVNNTPVLQAQVAESQKPMWEITRRCTKMAQIENYIIIHLPLLTMAQYGSIWNIWLWVKLPWYAFKLLFTSKQLANGCSSPHLYLTCLPKNIEEKGSNIWAWGCLGYTEIPQLISSCYLLYERLDRNDSKWLSTYIKISPFFSKEHPCQRFIFLGVYWNTPIANEATSMGRKVWCSAGIRMSRSLNQLMNRGALQYLYQTD